MGHEDNLDAANSQLDRVLGFFSRVETKASFLFAINTSLLAIMALNFSPADLAFCSEMIPAVGASILILVSFFFLYRSSFPNLRGGDDSLLYFRAIAQRAEIDFVQAFTQRSVEQHTHDLLGQVWRNSEILKMKFDAVKVSFILTAISLLPLSLFLIVAALHHPTGIILK